VYCCKLDSFISADVGRARVHDQRSVLPGRQHKRIGAGATEARGGKREEHVGNSLRMERRQIEGKCGGTIATEPRVSDGPAGVVISTLLLRNVPDSMEVGIVSLWRSK
jgi:hypothetical protein